MSVRFFFGRWVKGWDVARSSRERTVHHVEQTAAEHRYLRELSAGELASTGLLRWVLPKNVVWAYDARALLRDINRCGYERERSAAEIIAAGRRFALRLVTLKWRDILGDLIADVSPEMRTDVPISAVESALYGYRPLGRGDSVLLRAVGWVPLLRAAVLLHGRDTRLLWSHTGRQHYFRVDAWIREQRQQLEERKSLSKDAPAAPRTPAVAAQPSSAPVVASAAIAAANTRRTTGGPLRIDTMVRAIPRGPPSRAGGEATIPLEQFLRTLSGKARPRKVFELFFVVCLFQALLLVFWPILHLMCPHAGACAAACWAGACQGGAFPLPGDWLPGWLEGGYAAAVAAPDEPVGPVVCRAAGRVEGRCVELRRRGQSVLLVPYPEYACGAAYWGAAELLSGCDAAGLPFLSARCSCSPAEMDANERHFFPPRDSARDPILQESFLPLFHTPPPHPQLFGTAGGLLSQAQFGYRMDSDTAKVARITAEAAAAHGRVGVAVAPAQLPSVAERLSALGFRRTACPERLLLLDAPAAAAAMREASPLLRRLTEPLAQAAASAG